MQPPLLLFLKNAQEIQLFRRMEDLESSIEAIDVINQEYEAIDAAGRRITLVVNHDGAPTGLERPIEEDSARAGVNPSLLCVRKSALPFLNDIAGACDRVDRARHWKAQSVLATTCERHRTDYPPRKLSPREYSEGEGSEARE